MPKVQFTASKDVPSPWLHRKGGRREEPHRGGINARIVPPVWVASGDSIDMDEFEAQWCLASYPENFKIVETPEE